MLGFLRQALLFLLIGLLPLALLAQVSRQHPTSVEEGFALGRVDAARARAAELEALALGSSHGRAIDFEQLGLEGQELGLPWNDATEIEFQVRTLAPSMPRLRVVFIALSYFSFHWSNAHAGDDRLLTSRRLFYGSTPGLRWMPDDFDTFVEGKTYWIARPDHWYWVLAPLLGRDDRQEEHAEYYEDRTEEKDAAELDAHADRRVPGTLGMMAPMLHARADLPARNYAAFSRAIRLLQARGVRVVLFTPPYYPRYRELYAAQAGPMLAEMRVLATRLSAEHGVEYHDLSAAPLSLDPTNFRDSDHLNFRGKARFAPVIGEALARTAGPP